MRPRAGLPRDNPIRCNSLSTSQELQLTDERAKDCRRRLNTLTVMKRPEEFKHSLWDELPLYEKFEVHWLNRQSERRSFRYDTSEKNEALMMSHDVSWCLMMSMATLRSLTIISSRSHGFFVPLLWHAS